MASAWVFLVLTTVLFASVDAGLLEDIFVYLAELYLAKHKPQPQPVASVTQRPPILFQEGFMPVNQIGVMPIQTRGLVGDVFAGAVNTKGTYAEHNTRPRSLINNKNKELYGDGGGLSLHLANLVYKILVALFGGADPVSAPKPVKTN